MDIILKLNGGLHQPPLGREKCVAVTIMVTVYIGVCIDTREEYSRSEVHLRVLCFSDLLSTKNNLRSLDMSISSFAFLESAYLSQMLMVLKPK